MKEVSPLPLRVSDQPEQRAGLTELPAEAGIDGERPSLLGCAPGLLEVHSVPVHEAPGKERPGPLRGRGWLVTFHGQDLLVQRHGGWIGRHAQLYVEGVPEALELADGGLAVPRVEVGLHERAVRLLVGAVDLKDSLPHTCRL